MPRRTRRSANATCYVTNLSDELVVEIFSQLSRTPFAALGLARAASVCKAWRNLVKANEERLWKEVTLNEHGVESLEGGALEAMGFGWRRRCMVLGTASMRDTQFQRMNEHYDFFLECLDDRTDENLFPDASAKQKRSTVQLQAHQRMELGGLAGIGFTAKEQFTQTLDPTDVSMYVRRKADGKVALLFSAHITDSVTPDEDNGMIICDVSAVPPNWNLRASVKISASSSVRSAAARCKTTSQRSGSRTTRSRRTPSNSEALHGSTTWRPRGSVRAGPRSSPGCCSRQFRTTSAPLWGAGRERCS